MLTNGSALHTLGLFFVPSLCADADRSPCLWAFLENQMESTFAVLYLIYHSILWYHIAFYYYFGAFWVGGKSKFIFFICLYGNCCYIYYKTEREEEIMLSAMSLGCLYWFLKKGQPYVLLKIKVALEKNLIQIEELLHLSNWQPIDLSSNELLSRKSSELVTNQNIQMTNKISSKVLYPKEIKNNKPCCKHAARTGFHSLVPSKEYLYINFPGVHRSLTLHVYCLIKSLKRSKIQNASCCLLDPPVQSNWAALTSNDWL